MAKIAILGFGTVGSGVYEVLCRNAAGVSRRAGEPVEVKYILDPKDFSDHPAAQLFIKNFDAILEDPEVKVVVETIGVTRLRPILMTSLTTILGLIVTALAKNAGTSLIQPVALVCIGGLLYATLMTLFVVPCMYEIMNRRDLRKVDEQELEVVDM